MKKIKFLGAIFVVISMIFLMASCGSSKAPTSPENSSVQNKQQTNKTSSNDKDIKLSFPQIPGLADSKDKGILVEFGKALADEYKDGKITWDVYPIARAVQNIVDGTADVEMPQLMDSKLTDEAKAKLPYIFSTDTIYDTVFVLYVNKNNTNITAENANNFKLETISGHGKYFNNITESDYGAGLQKVDAGRIDGYIAPQSSGDATVKNLQLKNIKKIFYKTFPGYMILPNNEKGKQIDKTLSDLIAQLKANGKFQQIFASRLNAKFDESVQ